MGQFGFIDCLYHEIYDSSSSGSMAAFSQLDPTMEEAAHKLLEQV